MHRYGTRTFPKTGAIPIITEAKAERTCWDESEDNSCRRTFSNQVTNFKTDDM